MRMSNKVLIILNPCFWYYTLPYDFSVNAEIFVEKIAQIPELAFEISGTFSQQTNPDSGELQMDATMVIMNINEKGTTNSKLIV